jgi:SAM-dependent methyltransferase
MYDKSSDRSLLAHNVDVFEKVAAEYDQGPVPFFSVFGRELVELAGVRQGARVLDVGCGRGAALFPAAEAAGTSGSVVGIDLAPSMVERTAEEAKRRNLDTVSVRIGDAADPDTPAGSVDVVLGAMVLFLLSDPVAAARRYRRLVGRDGVFAFSSFVGFDERWAPQFEAVAPFFPAPDPDMPMSPGPLELFATEQTVREWLGAAGWPTAVCHERVHRFAFDSLDQWWRWSWSGAGRQLWAAIPADRRDEARAAAFAALAGVRGPDDRFPYEACVRYTVASVAA